MDRTDSYSNKNWGGGGCGGCGGGYKLTFSFRAPLAAGSLFGSPNVPDFPFNVVCSACVAFLLQQRERVNTV